MPKIFNNAFWIYGVVVGLAIREAFAEILSHLTLPNPPQRSFGETTIEAVRLVIFLAVIIKSYLGAGYYFDRVYAEQSDFQRKNFGFDFLFGMIHFMMFFAWSATITLHYRMLFDSSSFLVMLAAVLLYDFVWWAASIRFDTVRLIRAWAILNLFTVIAAFALLAIWSVGFKSRAVMAEGVSLIPVAFMTVVDFGEMFSGRNVVRDFIRNVISPDPPSNAAGAASGR